MDNPKVLVGCPVSDYHEYCTDEYIKSVKSLSYGNYDVLLVDNSKDEGFFNSIKGKVPAVRIGHSPSAYDRVIDSRNVLRQRALEGGYDYFLSLEQDVIPPKDVIERLLSYKKDIITGIYFKEDLYEGQGEPVALVWVMHPKDPNKVVPVKKSVIEGNNLIKVDFCGMGCILIHRSVLEKIRFRYDLSNCKATDDIFFGMDAKKEGFSIYADTAVKCRHLVSGRPWHWEDLTK